MNPFRALFDGVFMSRPMLWVPVWGFALFGYVRAREWMGERVVAASWPGVSMRALGEIVLFSCAVGSVYVMNQVADREVDQANGGFALLAHGRLSRSLAIGALLVYAFLPLIGGLVLGRWLLIAFSAAALLLGILYSFEPVRLSGRPVGDFVANALGYGGIAFGMGWYAAGAELNRALLGAALPYLLLMAAGSISSTLPDHDGDRAGGKRTTAVVLGPRGAHALALGLLAIGVGVAVVVGDWRAAVCAGAALPLYVAYAWMPTPLLMEMTYKVGGALSMLMIAVYVPVFVVVGGLTLLATRIYFKVRFGVRYPAVSTATTYDD